MPDRVFSEGIVLPDGRKIRVLAYDDGSVRIRFDGAPYVMTECFLRANAQGHAIVKVVPERPSNVATDGGLRRRLESFIDEIERLSNGETVRRGVAKGVMATTTLLRHLVLDPGKDSHDDSVEEDTDDLDRLIERVGIAATLTDVEE